MKFQFLALWGLGLMALSNHLVHAQTLVDDFGVDQVVETLPVQLVVPVDIHLVKPTLAEPVSGTLVWHEGLPSDGALVYQVKDDKGIILKEVMEPYTDHPPTAFILSNWDFLPTGNLNLEVAAYIEDELRAFGEKSFESPLEDLPPAIISDLQILKRDETFKVGFTFQNRTESLDVSPRVEVFVAGLPGEAPIANSSANTVTVGSLQKKRFSLDLDQVLKPGLYRFEVSLVSADESPLSGVLSEEVLVPGSYIKSLDSTLLVDDYRQSLGGSVLVEGSWLGEEEALLELVISDGIREIYQDDWSLPVGMVALSHAFDFQLDRFIDPFTYILRVKVGEEIWWEKEGKSPEFTQEVVASEVLSLEGDQDYTWVWFLMGILLFVGLLLILFRWVRRLTLMIYLALGIGGGGHLALSVHLESSLEGASVYWVAPQAGHTYQFDTDSAFRWMSLEGIFSKDLKGASLYDAGRLKAVVIGFQDNQGAKRYYQLNPRRVAWYPGGYRTKLDLSRFPGLNELDDGKIDVSIYFKLENQQGGLWYKGSPKGAEVIFDHQPPNIVFKKQQNEIKASSPFFVEVLCQDDGAGCGQNIFSVGEIYGNFCDDSTFCDSNGVRSFEVCDRVGNCVLSSEESSMLEIKGYDPVPPQIDLFSFGGASLLAPDNVASLKARERYEIDFSFDNISVWLGTEDQAIDKHVCKGDFHLKEGRCRLKNTTCLSGLLLGTLNIDTQQCEVTCPAGMAYDSKGYCTPKLARPERPRFDNKIDS